MGKKQMNNLAAILPMYEAFKKLEGILDEALDLLREGRAATDWNRWVWSGRAQGFIARHENRVSTSGRIAVGKSPEVSSAASSDDSNPNRAVGRPAEELARELAAKWLAKDKITLDGISVPRDHDSHVARAECAQELIALFSKRGVTP